MTRQPKSADRMQIFGSRLNGCRLRKGWTQTDLASAVGASLRSVQVWEKGENLPSPKKMRTLCEVLEVDVDFLTGGNSKDPVPRTHGGPYFGTRKEAPIISWASAGTSNSFEDQGLAVDHVPTSCKDPNCYALTIEGDSMLPRFEPGDVVVAMPNVEARNGDLVIAKVQDGSAYFKIYHRKGANGDMVQLTSYNDQRYPPMEFHRSELLFLHPVYSALRFTRRG